MATVAETAKRVIEPVCWPTREAVEENLRHARQVVETARHAAQHAVAEAGLNVCRHPLQSVVASAVVGVLIGGLLGFGAGWFASARR